MQFLMIATIKPGTPKRNVVELIRTEAVAAWKLYASDIVRTIHYKADLSGAVMMMEAETEEEIKNAINTLPMIQDGVLEAEIIPLKPYTAFGKLFEKCFV